MKSQPEKKAQQDKKQSKKASSQPTPGKWDEMNRKQRREMMVVTLDGQRAVSASRDQTLKLWDLETGEVIATFTCDRAAHCCTYYDALKLIVAGDEGGRVYFLSL